jgi:hypothetical protein
LVEAPFGLRPLVRAFRGDDLREIHSRQTRERARQFERFRFVVAGEDAAVLRALVTQDARELAGIDVGDRDNTLVSQILRQGFFGAKIRCKHGQITNDQAGGMDFRGFNVLGIHTDIADVRIRQRDDLLGVARIGQDFLITGDRGVEHHFADRVTGCAD